MLSVRERTTLLMQIKLSEGKLRFLILETGKYGLGKAVHLNTWIIGRLCLLSNKTQTMIDTLI